jgi:hypothetical protein
MTNQLTIITSYFANETYGILGPQLAAGLINAQTPHECRVLALTKEYNADEVIRQVLAVADSTEPMVAFSTLSGRPDLFDLAQRFRKAGATTLLAGPQAAADYQGETGRNNHPHRFQGLSDHFTYALHGPAEQGIDFLLNFKKSTQHTVDGLLYKDHDGNIRQNPPRGWKGARFEAVRWDTLFSFGPNGIQPHKIGTAQVLQQIGCPHASRKKALALGFPTALDHWKDQSLTVDVKGCSFCDVAVDKGYCGALPLSVVMDQIRSLPEDNAGRKIPFELINENPLHGLPELLRTLRKENIGISQINLIMRADWFLKGEERLREALGLAAEMKARILMSSMGFESFDDDLLVQFNKGVDVRTNINAVRAMRQLKSEFPHQWKYARQEGAVHGFIHPTPWDTPASWANIQKWIALYGLSNDILPAHSTPLIIHHASALGDWIRAVEEKAGICFPRYGSVIGWWDDGTEA